MSKRRGKRPDFGFLGVSVMVRKGKYVKGPTIGLYSNDNGPIARGSVKEDYLDSLREFLNKAAKHDQSVSFALFKNKKRQDDDDEDEDEEEDDEEENEEDEEEEEEDDEEEEEPENRKSKKSKKSGGKIDKKAGTKKGKKSDWDFD